MAHWLPSLDRRQFTAGLAGAALATGLARGQTRDQRPPNVVLLISDDQHWGDYGFMGHPRIRTPRLDALAAESLLFVRGYVASPLCCASLGAMLSGLHPHQSRITTNDPKMPAGQPRAQAYRAPEVLAQRERMFAWYRDAPMLPRVLGEALGYRSLQTGKWWGGHPANAGFTAAMSHGDPLRGGRHGDLGLDIGRTTMQPIRDFLDTVGEVPFLLWYAPMLPHQPHDPPNRLLDRYRDQTDSLHVARYWAMCEWFDETCGLVLDEIDGRGLRDNTLIIYLCDNGWIQAPDQARPAPRSKTTSYEGGARTPVMVRWPGRVAPARDETTPVSAVDVAPTILAACGLRPQAALQGVNLLDREALTRRGGVCGATYTHDAVELDEPLANLRERYLITDRWKLILPYRPNAFFATAQLFDVVTDPAEERDLAPAERDRVVALAARLEAWWPVADLLPVLVARPPAEQLDCDFSSGDPHGWRPLRQIDRVGFRDGAIVCEVGGDSPVLALVDCALPAARIRRVRVTLAATAGTQLALLWANETGPIGAAQRLALPLLADGRSREYVFEVAEHDRWTGVISRLRLDPTNAPGEVRLDAIRGE